jgi:uncharacterized membrane protein YeaQ/YmgE (transglycosylase-associated protein family)
MSHFTYILIGAFNGIAVSVLGKYFGHAFWTRLSHSMTVNILVGILGALCADLLYTLYTPSTVSVWEEIIMSFIGAQIFLFLANFLHAAFLGDKTPDGFVDKTVKH